MGGKERQLIELIKGLLTNNDVKCELAVMNKEIYYEEVFNLNIRIHLLIRNFKKDPFVLIKLLKIIKEFKPDIIHSFSPMTSFYSVFLKLFRKFIFFDGTIRSAPERKIVPFSTKMLNYFNFFFANAIIANSKAGLKSYNAPKRKSFAIYNGFDMSRLKNLESREKIRNKFGINTGKVVGMVANFTDKKDYDTYIIASKQIVKKRQNVTFLAVGNGVNFEYFKNKINNYDKIKLIGSQKRIESIINTFDICVLSTYTESCSNSIMEYMALGKPVIATDGGGTKELIIDGKTGYLVKVRDPEELAAKIEFLLANEKMTIKMGNAGKRIIETKFSLNKMIKSHYKLFQKY